MKERKLCEERERWLLVNNYLINSRNRKKKSKWVGGWAVKKGHDLSGKITKGPPLAREGTMKESEGFI